MAKRVNIKSIIEAFKEVQGNKTQAGVLAGVSRWTVSRWAKRGKSISQYTPTYTFKGLKRKSTKPHAIRKALTIAQENKVILLRREHDVCVEKLEYILEKQGIKVSDTTLQRLINKKGLVRETGYHRRPLFQNGHAMRPRNTTTTGYLQADVKYATPELSGLPYTAYEYAFIDIFSRFKTALILPVLDEAGSIITLKWAIQQMPFKIVYIQTDNGLEFQSQFNKLCRDENIKHYHIHKNSPNENAVVERSFRIDQDEFYFKLKEQPQDINELNAMLQEFLKYYNYERPHLGLKMLTPKEKLDTVANVMRDQELVSRTRYIP